ncbi:CG0192-related protein [Phytoactinopolyspora limicola]|uniref:CG0192-related protein n=1 Tax=Phytoactinopolyspora limicola TaxID=2715536 RepID=UPI00140C9DEB|nr:hypothetical protein [Phytoactinopolyspora limicola]
MALIHKATMTPTKKELLADWLPTRGWWPGGGGPHVVGAYRLDDPEGEVGIEAMLVASPDGALLHVPLTYRGAALPGAESFLVGTSEHSVLGTRWIYDGCGDPVWAAQTAAVILSGGAQAEETVDAGDGTRKRREPSVRVDASGGGAVDVGNIDAVTARDDGPTTLVQAGDLEIVLVRVVGTDVSAPHTLTGRWADGGPSVLAGVRT